MIHSTNDFIGHADCCQQGSENSLRTSLQAIDKANSYGSYGKMNFSEKLTCAIQLHRLTQEELAQATGLSQSTVSQLSNAKQRPYLDQAFKLARILGLSLEFLADDELDREPVGLSEDERYLLRTFRNSTLTADQAVTALIEYAKALGKNMERPTPDDRVELRSGAGSAPVVKPRQEHLVAEETSKAKKPKTRRSRKNNAN